MIRLFLRMFRSIYFVLLALAVILSVAAFGVLLGGIGCWQIMLCQTYHRTLRQISETDGLINTQIPAIAETLSIIDMSVEELVKQLAQHIKDKS